MPTVTMTIATPCVVSHTAHGFTTGARMVGLSTNGALPTGIDTLGYFYPSVIDADSYYLASTRESAVKAISNLAVTFNATTDIFSATAHGFAIGDSLRFTAATMPTGFSVGVDYYVIAANFTANQFQVSLIKGGAANLGTSTGTSVLAHTLISTSGSQSGTHTGGEILGRVDEVNQSVQDGSAFVKLSNVPLPVNVILTNIVNGSRVRVSKAADNAELYLGTPGTLASFSTKFTGNVYVDVRKKGYIPYRQPAAITADGLSLYVSQVADTVVV